MLFADAAGCILCVLWIGCGTIIISDSYTFGTDCGNDAMLSMQYYGGYNLYTFGIYVLSDSHVDIQMDHVHDIL